MFSAQYDAVDKIINVSHVISDIAAAYHSERPVADCAKQLQKSCVAGSVYADRPEYRPSQTPINMFADQELAREFAFLVDVERPERRILIRRWVDVAVHTDSAAMHETTDVFIDARIDDISRALDVYLGIGFVGVPRFPVESRDVINHIASLRCTTHVGCIHQITGDSFNAIGDECLRFAGVAHQRPDTMPASFQLTRQMAAGETRRSGHQYQHEALNPCSSADAQFSRDLAWLVDRFRSFTPLMLYWSNRTLRKSILSQPEEKNPINFKVLEELIRGPAHGTRARIAT
jgi:hypothetical protein